MKTLLSTLVVVGVLGGCNRTFVSDPRAWFIEMYENGEITVLHDGNVYKATCESSASYTVDHHNDTQSTTCKMPAGMVGHKIRHFDGKFEGIERDADGRFAVMWDSGNILILRSWLSDDAWTQEWFNIKSVANNAHR